MLRARDLRVLDEDELEGKLRELKETLFNLRFQHATGQLDNPMKIKETRRDIARVCTAMSELKYGIAFEAAPAAELEEPEEVSDIAAEELEEEEELAEELMEAPESDEQLEEEVEEELEDK